MIDGELNRRAQPPSDQRREVVGSDDDDWGPAGTLVRATSHVSQTT